MIVKFRFGRWRITFSLAPVTDVIGVHSNLEDGNHIVMWDFDDTTLNQVITNLLPVQRIYALPNIHILLTKSISLHYIGDGKKERIIKLKDLKGKGNYIAYCFKRLPWRKVIEIISFTKGVDYNFLKYGIYRDKFTLRVTPKAGRKPKLIYILKSNGKADAEIKDLKRWVKYETVDHDNPPFFACKGCNSLMKHCITIGE